MKTIHAKIALKRFKQIFATGTAVAIMAGFGLCLIHPEPILAGSNTRKAECVGKYAPDFSLSDSQGNKFSTSTHPNKERVIVFLCGCSRCKAAAKRIFHYQKVRHFPDVLAVTTLSRQGITEFQRQTGIKGLLLSDADGATFNSYKVANCPKLFLVSHSRIIYEGYSGTHGSRINVDLDNIRHCLQLK